MRGVLLIVAESDRATAKSLGEAAWPETARGMFDNALMDSSGATLFVNCMSNVSDTVFEQLLGMKSAYLPNAQIETFDIDEAGSALRILSELGLTRKEE